MFMPEASEASTISFIINTNVVLNIEIVIFTRSSHQNSW